MAPMGFINANVMLIICQRGRTERVFGPQRVFLFFVQVAQEVLNYISDSSLQQSQFAYHTEEQKGCEMTKDEEN